MYYHKEKDVIARSFAEVVTHHPNTSFPRDISKLTVDNLVDLGWAVVEEVKPEYDENTQRLEPAQTVTEVVAEDESVTYQFIYSVVALSTEEIARRESSAQLRIDVTAERVRRERDILLSNTDWIVTMSLEKGVAIPTEWATYRQELRDITLQEGFPLEVVFPTKPA